MNILTHALCDASQRKVCHNNIDGRKLLRKTNRIDRRED